VTADNKPDMSAGGLIDAGAPRLALSSANFNSGQWPEYRTTKPLNLVKGQKYAFLFINVAPMQNPNIKLNRTAASNYMKSNPRSGAQGYNGNLRTKRGTGYALNNSPKIGPYWGDTGLIGLRSNDGRSWEAHIDHTPFANVLHSDGRKRGMIYTDWERNYGARLMPAVEGNNQVRQVWKQPYNVRANGVWIGHSHNKTTTPNGQPMTATLREDNKVIATATIRPDLELAKRSRMSDMFENRTQRSTYADLSNTVNLVAGKNYTLTLSAPSGAGFVITTGHEADNSIFSLTGGAQAQSGGGGWQSVSPRYSSNDIMMLFTLEGGPKRMP
jgi:hypothetical protein